MSVAFNPFRYPGTRDAKLRVLTTAEDKLIGAPCPFCKDGTLRLRKTRFSEYVSCTNAPGCDRYFTPEMALEVVDALGAGLATADGAVRMRGLVSRMKDAPRIPGVASDLTEKPRTLSPDEIEKAKAEFPAKKHPRAKDLFPKKDVFAFAEHMAEAKAAKRAAQEPKVQEPKAVTYDVLYPRIKKLADGVQKAYKSNTVSAGFALRREVMCAKLWRAARAASLAPQDALKLAFALTASERATEEEKNFYDGLWRAEFGDHLYPLPIVYPKSVLGEVPDLKPGEVLHPSAGIALMVIKANIPLWMVSEAGEGKSVLTKQAARLFSLNYTRLQGTLDRTVDEVIGGFGFAEGETKWRDGVICAAARTPTLFHNDEVTAFPHEVQFEMHALLEGEPIMQARNGGVLVPLHPQFRMVANDNSVGQGEAINYVGTRSTNLAFRDRWAFLRLDVLPDDLRRQIVLTASE